MCTLDSTENERRYSTSLMFAAPGVSGDDHMYDGDQYALTPG